MEFYMNKSLKIIIFGFALMFIGGICLLVGFIVKDIPAYMVLLSYGLFIGFILIMIGLLTHENNKLYI
jgi:hypothetical protein